ncbi:MAG TPA: glycosyltransferase [Anaerolineae bacterium]|nr:glycosyltransferase [Anaerolineae bacterium]
MRILHIIHQYLPDHIGGTELYTHWLTQELARRGHEIAIFYRRSADGSGLSRRTEDDIEIWAAWNGRFQPTDRFLSTFRNPFLLNTFTQALDQIQPDVVHVEHLMGLPAGILTILQKRRIPYVVTLWDFWWVCANAQLLTNDTQEICAGPDKFTNCARCVLARSGSSALKLAQPLLPLPLAQRNRILKNSLSHAAALIAPAPFVKNWYASHGISAERMTVVPPGLDYPADAAREAEGVRPFRIGYIGGLSWQKGVHVLVNAFTQLSAPAELWIAGDPDFDPDYVAQLRQLANGNARFVGKLDRDDVWQMLAQVDVIVVPSLWYETFCFVVSEAFAMGVPVIASDLGVLADRVQDGADGFLFPPGDDAGLAALLRRCQAEPDLLPDLRANIHPGLTVAQHTDQIEAVYRRVSNP